jgi:PleD family two-component response regulator
MTTHRKWSGKKQGILMNKQTTQRRVLVVNDNRDTSEQVASILDRHGYITLVAFDPTETLSTAHDFLPDVVLLNVETSSMDGCNTAVELRKISGLKRVRIVALAASNDPDSMEQMAKAGFDELLAKTPTMDAIVLSCRA